MNVLPFVIIALILLPGIALAVPTYAPENYSDGIKHFFTKNMTVFDGVQHADDFYVKYLGSYWLLVLLLVPYIALYKRQGSILIIAVIYLTAGATVWAAMPVMFAKIAFYCVVLGIGGIIYGLFVE